MFVVTAFIPSSSMSTSARIATTELFSASSFMNEAMLAADATDAAAAVAATTPTSATVADIILPTTAMTMTPIGEAATATATATFEPVLLGAVTTTTAFEPVLNVPALVASLGILVGAAVLRWRQSSIATAAEQRIHARQRLRELKTQELTRGDGGNTAQIQQAVWNYEQALQKEGQLRTVLPGIALRAPNNPINSEQDQQAIQQFLKKKNGGSGSKAVQIQEENLQTLQQLQQQPQQSSASPSSFVNSNDDDDDNNKSTVDEDEISQVGPLLGLCAVLALLVSPQFLTLFINENDTLEILDILSSQ